MYEQAMDQAAASGPIDLLRPDFPLCTRRKEFQTYSVNVLLTKWLKAVACVWGEMDGRWYTRLIAVIVHEMVY
jgi:hypothetical protein